MTGGIYKITCVPTGDFYIGSTVSFRNRKNSHWCDMRMGRKKALWGTLLQKYTLSDFEFTILEESSVENLIPLENKWLLAELPTLNLSSEASFRPYQHGTANPASVHSEEAIYTLFTTVLENPWRPLSSIDIDLGFCKGTSQKLVSGNRYTHLKDLYPEKYELLISGKYKTLKLVDKEGNKLEVQGNIDSIAQQLGISDVSAGKLVHGLAQKVCGYSRD